MSLIELSATLVCWYGSPGAATSPCGVIAVVPEINNCSPIRTAREYPRSGSKGEPDAILVLVVEFATGKTYTEERVR